MSRTLALISALLLLGGCGDSESSDSTNRDDSFSTADDAGATGGGNTSTTGELPDTDPGTGTDTGTDTDTNASDDEDVGSTGGDDGSSGSAVLDGIGAACVDDADCSGMCLGGNGSGDMMAAMPGLPATLVNLLKAVFPGGYCTAPCTSDAACSEGACMGIGALEGLSSCGGGGMGGGATAGAMLEPFSICMATCATTSDCRDGYECQTIGQALGLGAGMGGGAGAGTGPFACQLQAVGDLLGAGPYCLPPTPERVPPAPTPTP